MYYPDILEFTFYDEVFTGKAENYKLRMTRIEPVSHLSFNHLSFNRAFYINRAFYTCKLWHNGQFVAETYIGVSPLCKGLYDLATNGLFPFSVTEDSGVDDDFWTTEKQKSWQCDETEYGMSQGDILGSYLTDIEIIMSGDKNQEIGDEILVDIQDDYNFGRIVAYETSGDKKPYIDHFMSFDQVYDYYNNDLGDL